MKYFYYLITILGILAITTSAQDQTDRDIPAEPSEADKSLPEDTEEASVEDEMEDEKPPTEEALKVEPSIFDEREILTLEQAAKIKEVQQRFYSNHQCIVSYGFYDGHLPSITVRQKWKNMVALDDKRQFHIFLNIGVLRKSNIVEIYYRYPPGLKNMGEIDTVLTNLKRDLQSEIGLDALLERSYESVNDELGYLGTKPEYESNIQQEVNAFEATRLKKYLFKILKIAVLIIAPIIALLLIWSIFSRIRNKLSYRFPDVDYIERFGSKYSATSIAKIRK